MIVPAAATRTPANAITPLVSPVEAVSAELPSVDAAVVVLVDVVEPDLVVVVPLPEVLEVLEELLEELLLEVLDSLEDAEEDVVSSTGAITSFALSAS